MCGRCSEPKPLVEGSPYCQECESLIGADLQAAGIDMTEPNRKLHEMVAMHAAMVLVKKMASRRMAYMGEVPTHNETKDDYTEARRIAARADVATINGESVEAIAARISSTPPPDDGQQQPPEPCQP